ncbi:MAG: 2-dehydro-3-deoxyphosphooctonate aldolase [Flavobacterium sp. BFFFF2]|nr:MAG: 2-dehydro-3-deoxyphosphooctonate aldolase [Flavobacterium sp. BFFFF2]
MIRFRFFGGLALFFLALVSCVSTKSTLKNVDPYAPIPKLIKPNQFIVTDYSKDPKYGFDPDYPVNVFYQSTKNDTINAVRYLNALAGPKGEKLTFKKVNTCCPFPTKNTGMGAGMLDIYELQWAGNSKPIQLYVNSYERGFLLIPIGLTVKK